MAAAIVSLFAIFGFFIQGAITDWDYEIRHKIMSQAMWAWVEYDKCRDQVKESALRTCMALGVAEEDCPIDYSQCDKFKEKAE